MSSGNESDDSSNPDSPGPSQNIIVTPDQPLQMQQIHQQLHQVQQQIQQSQHQDLIKHNLGNVLYPSALSNLPQEVLVNLVNAGHLQIQTDDGEFFFIISSIHLG